MDYIVAFKWGVWAFVATAGFVLCAVGAVSVVGILSSIAHGVFGKRKDDDA